MNRGIRKLSVRKDVLDEQGDSEAECEEGCVG